MQVILILLFIVFVRMYYTYICYTPCGVQPWTQQLARAAIGFISINAPHAGCNSDSSSASNLWHGFQSNAPRARCNSKTIQFKRILVARRMYSFANYVLHILKHSPTYCIGTTLQPLIFGAKLPVILCSLKVRTDSITLL